MTGRFDSISLDHSVSRFSSQESTTTARNCESKARGVLLLSSRSSAIGGSGMGPAATDNDLLNPLQVSRRPVRHVHAVSRQGDWSR